MRLLLLAAGLFAALLALSAFAYADTHCSTTCWYSYLLHRQFCDTDCWSD